MIVLLALLAVVGLGKAYMDPICNPTIGYCSEHFNQTKLPNKFNEDSYAKIISKLVFKTFVLANETSFCRHLRHTVNTNIVY